MSIFYIADTHIGHENIIRYDNRPFSSIQEMNDEIVSRWNQAVRDNDTVYILGDFSWYNSSKTCEYLDSLAGHKILVKGNHDSSPPHYCGKSVYQSVRL